MEILFSQKMEYSTITPYRNYSSITSQVHPIVLTVPAGMEIGGDIFYKPTRSINCINNKDFYLDQPTKKRGKYFYAPPCDDNDIEQHIHINLNHLFNKRSPSFSTTKRRHLIRHFANPFSSITIDQIERSIVKRDNKITIKLYHRTKRRDLNWKYFKIIVSIYSLTIDTNTGNFTVSEIENSKERKRKKFRRNYFPSLLEMVNRRYGLFEMNDENYHILGIKDEFKSIFNNKEFYDAVNNALEFHTLKEWSSDATYPGRLVDMKKKDFIDNFIQYFVTKKRIRIPNNFRELLVYYYPTEKYFKKNKRKLIASILDKYHIKSRVTIKLLHTVPNIDICTLVKLCMLLGKDYPKYIGSINPANFNGLSFPLYSMNYSTLSQIQSFNPSEFKGYDITDIEKENIVSIINTIKFSGIVTPAEPIKAFYSSLLDHFDMIIKIRPYVPGIYLNARTYNDFNQEHLDYSKILTLIKKPFVIEYVFDEESVELIEKRIPMIPFEKEYTDEDYLYPVLLKREEEYLEEGSHMHHCVAGYADKETSIIVSLRTKDNQDRVTSEFNIKTGECWQSRHFHNGAVPQNFEYALTVVKNRINDLSKKDKLKWIEKKNVRVVINGVEIPDFVQVPQHPGQQIQRVEQFEDVDIVW